MVNCINLKLFKKCPAGKRHLWLTRYCFHQTEYEEDLTFVELAKDPATGINNANPELPADNLPDYVAGRRTWDFRKQCYTTYWWNSGDTG